MKRGPATQGNRRLPRIGFGFFSKAPYSYLAFLGPCLSCAASALQLKPVAALQNKPQREIARPASRVLAKVFALKTHAAVVARIRPVSHHHSPRQITGFVRRCASVNKSASPSLHRFVFGFSPFATVFIAGPFFICSYHCCLFPVSAFWWARLSQSRNESMSLYYACFSEPPRLASRSMQGH